MKRHQRHCKNCNAPRKGSKCWKCNGALHKPSRKWTYPKLPPIKKIQALAREVGYSIGIHGSRERDLDLIAAPWTTEAIGNYGLMKHIADGLDAEILEVERKPLGRYACTIRMKGWYKHIDLSVCPIETQHTTEVQDETSKDPGWDLQCR